MPDAFTVRYWRDRAEEARTLAEKMGEAEVRETLLRIADGYERSELRAEEIRLLHGSGGTRTNPG
jgi:hypothetical protein